MGVAGSGAADSVGESEPQAAKRTSRISAKAQITARYRRTSADAVASSRTCLANTSAATGGIEICCYDSISIYQLYSQYKSCQNTTIAIRMYFTNSANGNGSVFQSRPSPKNSEGDGETLPAHCEALRLRDLKHLTAISIWRVRLSGFRCGFDAPFIRAKAEISDIYTKIDVKKSITLRGFYSQG